MAKDMEEEIDGLDLEKGYTGEKEPEAAESPKEPEAKEPGQEPDGGKEPPSEEPEKPEDGGKGDGQKEPDGKDQFGVKGHTPKGVQERINELSRSNRELREQNARILAELEGFRKGLPKPKEKTRDDFANDEEWIDYRAEKKAREMVESMRSKEREEAEEAEAGRLFAKSEEEARGRLDDYDYVMSMDVNLPVDRDTYMYVRKSPLGADVLYALKKIETVRNQFLMTPDAGKIAFVKQVEERIRQIREKPAQTQTPQQVPAQTQPPQPPAAPAIRQPQEVRHPVSRGLDPATCSMQEWMDNGD